MNKILTLLSAERMREYYAAGFWRDETIYGSVSAHARRAPGSPAIREARRRVGYGELVAAADCLAAELAQHGVEEGQRVCVWLPSRIEAVVALLACSRNG